MINQDTYDENYIYIPIWLDLLFPFDMLFKRLDPNLHSNMVRFIIRDKERSKNIKIRFTFQYG